MALTQRGKFRYGESQTDIRAEIVRYSELNGYGATQFADAGCGCGNRVFHLHLDDNEGAAVRECSQCKQKHPIGDSEEYLADAELQECECPCGAASFEITVGVALYDSSEDVRWLYLGCRCPKCGLTACYGDWKNEFTDYRKLLANV
jgi:hypothetical protein